MSDLLVRAAGGVLLRHPVVSKNDVSNNDVSKNDASKNDVSKDDSEAAAESQVLLVHRPGYDDWSFPKGKADGDELDEDTALREVEEETGYACTLGAEIATSHYVDRRGRPKRVRWYRMEPVEDRGFEPDNEVDERRWVPLSEAVLLLTYDRDRDVLEQLGKVDR